MCAEGSRGGMNVKGAFSEGNNLALLLIYALPLKHNRFLPSYVQYDTIRAAAMFHLAHKYSGSL